MTTKYDHFGARALLPGYDDIYYYRLGKLAEAGIGHIDRLPFSIKVLLETLRNVDGYLVQPEDEGLASWNATRRRTRILPSCLRASFCRISRACRLSSIRRAALGYGPSRRRPDAD